MRHIHIYTKSYHHHTFKYQKSHIIKYILMQIFDHKFHAHIFLRNICGRKRRKIKFMQIFICKSQSSSYCPECLVENFLILNRKNIEMKILVLNNSSMQKWIFSTAVFLVRKTKILLSYPKISIIQFFSLFYTIFLKILRKIKFIQDILRKDKCFITNCKLANIYEISGVEGRFFREDQISEQNWKGVIWLGLYKRIFHSIWS